MTPLLTKWRERKEQGELVCPITKMTTEELMEMIRNIGSYYQSTLEGLKKL